MSRVLACAVALAACGRASATDPGPALAILGESTRLRLEDPLPRSTPWFDGARVSLVAARGETIGLQIVRSAHDENNAVDVSVVIPGAEVRLYDVESFRVDRPSTALYGGSHGRGRYADGLVAQGSRSAASGPRIVTYVDVIIPRDARPGIVRGELVVGDARYPIELAIANVTIPDRAPRVWAYQDPRELAWAKEANSAHVSTSTAPSSAGSSSAGSSSAGSSSAGSSSAAPSSAGSPSSSSAGPSSVGRSNPSRAVPSADERACTAMFREHGVLLSPDVHLDWWPARRADFAGIRDVPVVIPSDPAKAGEAVRGWIAATKGTGHVPFSIPIDEPRTGKRIREVVELGKVIRAAGGGPTTFRFAVTADPRPEYLGLVDLFIQLRPAAHSGAWQYNGIAPWSGTMVLDAKTPGTRTWGWIAHRDAIPQWYVWDALYWHDRHNRKGAPLPGRALDPARDPISFDDGEDQGNLDGVLALPGCRPTLRLAALRRGQQDRALLELADACDPMATAAVVARTMPERDWPTDESVWEESRRELIQIAGCER